jgi:hypothetical protein
LFCAAPVLIQPIGVSTPTPVIDLSAARKLRRAVFWPQSSNIEWITAALETITWNDHGLQQISIYVDYREISRIAPNVEGTIGERTHRWWFDLDRLIVQFWESHSIRSELVCTAQRNEGPDMRACFERLLPEVTKKGLLEAVV